MSTLQLHVDRQLARTVTFTGRLKQVRFRLRATKAVVHGLDYFARGIFHVWRNRRYLTALKLINMALVNVQFRLKTEYVFGRPYNMKIESTNICNTKCQLCPTGQGLEGRPKGRMDISAFRKLIDQLKRFLFGLDLSMWGDPLIVPEIYDMIRYAHDRGIWTYLSSNLHALKITPEKRQAEALVKSGLDMLTCSLHGASQETFAIYQPGKSFADTLEKVKHIIAVRDALGSATPTIQLNFVVTRFNEHERPKFEALAKQLGCKAVFSTASMNIRFLGRDKQLHDLGLAPDILKKKVRDHLEKWLPRDDAYVLKPYKQLLENDLTIDEFNGKKLFDCSWPWKASVINWDGTVCACCGSFDPNEDFGNVFEQSFAKVWNSHRYRMARRSFKNKLEAADAKDNPCASCPGFMI